MEAVRRARIVKMHRSRTDMFRRWAAISAAVAVVFLAASGGCRLSDVREATVRVPGVRNAAAAAVVRRAVGTLKGVETDRLAFDFARGTVLVRYDSMQLGLKNIEHAIRDAGFDANELPANPAARAALPPDARNALPELTLPQPGRGPAAADPAAPAAAAAVP
jgi:copper chaperone CopZ